MLVASQPKMSRLRLDHVLSNLKQTGLCLEFRGIFDTPYNISARLSNDKSTILDKYRMAVQPIVPSCPPTKIVDVLGKWLMFSRVGDSPSKTFLNLTFELVETHIINRILETNPVKYSFTK